MDRFPRRLIVVASDALQGILVAALAALAYPGSLTILHLYALAGLFGVAAAFSMPALGAFLPETVPPEALQEANSLFQGTRSAMGVAGPAVGAAIIALSGTPMAFAFDAVTFAVSAALLAWVRGFAPMASEGLRPGRSPLAQLREGIAYVRRVPWLWITILVFTLANAAEAGPRNAVLPKFVAVDLGGGATGIGLVMSAQLGGMLVGYLGPTLLPRTRRRGLVAYAATAALGTTVSGLGLATALWQVITLSVARGVAMGLFSLLWQTSIMEYVHEGVRGRVISLDMLGSFALLPVSFAFSGALADTLGVRTVFVLGGITVLLCASVSFLYPSARAFGPQPERGSREGSEAPTT